MALFADLLFDGFGEPPSSSFRELHITSADSIWRGNVVKSLAHLPEVFDIKLVGPASTEGKGNRLAIWLFDWGHLSSREWRDFCAQRKRTRDINLLVAGAEPSVFWAEQALRAGAQGFISREAPPKELATAISEILEGRIFLSKEIAIPVTRRIFSNNDTPSRGLIGLNAQENLLIQALAGGCRSRDLPAQLKCSKESVEELLRSVNRALGLNGIKELKKLAGQLVFVG